MLNTAFTGSATKPVYKAVLLSSHSARQIAQLIGLTRDSLPEDMRHFLKPKSLGQIGAHFAAFNPAFGIFNHKQQLIGCALLCPLDPDDDHAAQNYPAEHLLPGHWALQSVARHPDYKGHGLMELLLEQAKTYAAANPQVEYVVAKVNHMNDKSQQGFINAGFSVAAKGQDVASGDPVVYLGLYTGSGLAPDTGRTLQSGYDEPTTPQRR